MFIFATILMLIGIIGLFYALWYGAGLREVFISKKIKEYVVEAFDDKFVIKELVEEQYLEIKTASFSLWPSPNSFVTRFDTVAEAREAIETRLMNWKPDYCPSYIQRDPSGLCLLKRALYNWLAKDCQVTGEIK